MENLTLHEDPISGNCYKIVFTASLLGLPLSRRAYSIAKGETRTPDFLRNISVAGQIPVLQVGTSTFIPESNAACFFLADNIPAPDNGSPSTTSTSTSLIPTNRLHRAEMLRWMFFEQNQHETSVAVLRSWLKIIGVENLSEERRAQIATKRRQGENALDVVEARLKESSSGFLVDCGMTLADVCLYAYTHVAYEGGFEGGFEMGKWPAIGEWCKRIEGVEGFVRWD
jgi:glutathione S-transferase